MYKKIAEECEIEKNSRVHVPDEALKSFVRLIISENKSTPFIQLAYQSGLFNGSGTVDFESVYKYYNEINKKIEEIETKLGKQYVSFTLGVDEYIQKNNNINKNKL